jgi:hypothetical protein
MLAFLKKHLPFEGELFNPPAHLKRLRLDVGLAFNAPMSEMWLAADPELCVVGFEPNEDSLRLMLCGPVPDFPVTGTWMKRERIGKTFFPVPCALWSHPEREMEFYKITGAIGKGPDAGCSGRWPRPELSGIITEQVTVPAMRLCDFFACVPWDRFPRVDYLKIDAEVSDSDILHSAGRYLSERVVYVTAETRHGVEGLLRATGFVPVAQYTVDPTYFNPRFMGAPGVADIVCRQC